MYLLKSTIARNFRPLNFSWTNILWSFSNGFKFVEILEVESWTAGYLQDNCRIWYPHDTGSKIQVGDYIFKHGLYILWVAWFLHANSLVKIPLEKVLYGRNKLMQYVITSLNFSAEYQTTLNLFPRSIRPDWAFFCGKLLHRKILTHSTNAYSVGSHSPLLNFRLLS